MAGPRASTPRALRHRYGALLAPGPGPRSRPGEDDLVRRYFGVKASILVPVTLGWACIIGGLLLAKVWWPPLGETVAGVGLLFLIVGTIRGAMLRLGARREMLSRL